MPCGLSAGIGNGEACDEHALDTADKNLTRSLSVLRSAERFKETLMLVAKTFGREVRFMRIEKF